MKVVKLNSRFRAYREHRHTVALRFLTWDDQASAAERAAIDLYGSQYSADFRIWRGRFGVASGHTPRKPYWISFCDPAHLTMVLLRAELK